MNSHRARHGLLVVTALFGTACATVPPPPDAGPPLDELDPVPPSAAQAPADAEATREPERAVVQKKIERRESSAGAKVAQDSIMTADDVVEAVSKEVSGKEAWAIYQTDQRFDCVGPMNSLDRPYTFRAGESNVTIEGWRVEMERRGDVRRSVRVGVLSAVKDKYPATLQNLTEFLNWFEREGVELVIVNGDVAYEGEDLMRSLELIARSNLPIWVLPGNSDPVAGFNLALAKLSARYPNLMSGSFIRLIQVGPTAFIGLPGYYDAEYIPSGRGCQYYADDLETLERLAKRAKGTSVLVSHGPPKGNHPNDIDYAFDAGNVGDERLTKAMQQSRLRLGIFGHILESGGRTSRGPGGQAVAVGKWSNRLWVNAGSSSSVEQDLHDGEAHKGMAVIVEVDGAKSKARVWFEVRRP